MIPAALRRRPAAVWLLLASAVVLVIAIPYVLAISNYTVMPDELGYMKQAVHFGNAWRPSIDGDMWFNSYAQLGPLLFAPGYALLSTPDAFDVAHVVSAVAFASTVLPVYLLARLVTEDQVAAVLAAALSVAVPWLSMTATLMTEPIAYPAFAWAIFAMTRAIERRTTAADAAALIAIGVATLARTQLVVLVPAYLAAVAVVALRAPDRRAELAAALRGHGVVVAVLALGVVAVIVSPSTVLGAYAGPLEGDLLPPGMLAHARELVAYVAIGSGVVTLPFGVAFVLLTLWRPASRRALAFAAVAASSGVVLALMSGSVSARYTAGINDRYLCFLAPILMVATLALLVDRRAASLPLCVAGAVGAALFATADLVQSGPSLVTPTQTFMPVLNGRSQQLGAAIGVEALSAATTLAIAVAAVCAVLALIRRRFRARPLGLTVGAALVALVLAETIYVLERVEETQAGVSQEFLQSRGWLDRVTPGDEPIGLLLGEVSDPATTTAVWWDTSFWSARADRVWIFPGTPMYDQGFGRGVQLDEETGRMPELDERRLIAMSAQERRFALQGAEPVGGYAGVEVVRVAPPVRAAWTLTTEAGPGFVTAAGEARLRVFGDGRPGPRDVAVVVTASPQLAAGSRARVGTPGRARTVRPDAATTLTARVTLPAVGHRDLPLDVASARPAAPADPAAGVLVTDVRVTPPS